MNKMMIALIGLAALTGCSTTAVLEYKEGASQLNYLKADAEPVDDAEKIKDDLSRQVNLTWNGSTSLILTLKTLPLKKAQISDQLKKQAFKEKWDDKKLQAELKKEYAKLAKPSASTCFAMEIRTNDIRAKDEKSWHGELEADAAKLPVEFSSFVGYSLGTTTVYGSRYSARATTTYDYYLMGTACVNQQIDATKTIKLLLEPRFKEGIKPVTLVWRDPSAPQQTSKP